MKTYMPLDGFRWSCDSDSALCDIPQTNVLGQAGGKNTISKTQLSKKSRLIKQSRKQKAPDASRTEGSTSSFNHETMRSQNSHRSWMPHGLAAVLN